MLRLASSTVVSNALRAVSAPRILSGSITNAFNGSDQDSLKRETPFISHHQLFSTDAKKSIDEKLAKILKAEIKFNRLSIGETIVTPSTPPHFPFTIEYSPCAKMAILTRKLNGEVITAKVSLPDHDEEEDDSDDESDYSDDDSDSVSSDGTSSESDDAVMESEKSACGGSSVPHVHVVVKISKANGKIFKLRLAATSNEIHVFEILLMEPEEDCSSLEEEDCTYGPYHVNKDSDLALALVEYLEVRGFDKCIGEFLHKYMVCKSKKDPVTLLKRVKKFVRD